MAKEKLKANKKLQAIKKEKKPLYIIVVIFIVLVLLFVFSQKIPVVKNILPPELSIDSAVKETENEKDIPKYQTIADGAYFDRLSKRATLDVHFENGIYYFEINWGSSAKENTKWTFSGRFDKYNSLVFYEDSCCVTEIYEDDGSVSKAEVYTGGHGVMKYDNKVLYWVDENEDKYNDPNYNAIFEKPDDVGVDSFTNTYNIANGNNISNGMIMQQQPALMFCILRYDRNAFKYNNGAPMVTRIPIIGSNNVYLANAANNLLPSAYKSIDDWIRTHVSFTKYQDYFINLASIKSFTENRINMYINCSLLKKGILSEHLTFELTLKLDENRYEWKKISDNESRRVH